MIRTAFAALALIAIPTGALAQDKPAESGQPPARIRSVTLAADQKCPPATTPDEIVICTTVEDPYRIPKTLRGAGPIPPQRQSWVNRAASLDEIGRVNGGLPNTCSVIGSGGATGCSAAAVRAWAAEKRAKANGQAEQ
ncbi:MAG: hypothetical protein V4459_03370 [Pseudomonadota bacterium]